MADGRHLEKIVFFGMLDGVRDVLSSLICSMVFAKAVSFCHLLFLFLLIFLLFGYDNLTLGVKIYVHRMFTLCR